VTLYRDRVSSSPTPPPTDGPEPSEPPTSARRSAVGPVWTRKPVRKAERLTLEAIVAAAMKLADAEGLEAVSVRRVAAELHTRPMSLYSHMARKDDLIDLITDEVLGEMLLTEEVPGDWRAALHAIARRTRSVAERHPWIMGALTQRPRVGPNALRHMEQSLGAIASLAIDRGTAMALLRAVDSYTIGCGVLAFADRQMQTRDQLADSEWRASTAEYFERLKQSNDFPRITEFGPDLLSYEEDWGDVFETGLDWLLRGFVEQLGGRVVLPPSTEAT
jgi:AcrR family transcriptional regulator